MARRWGLSLTRLPLALTLLRLALAPLMVLLSERPHPLLFGLILTAAVLSDIFDGILARRLGVATPSLRRLDSAVDVVFYLAVGFALWLGYGSSADSAEFLCAEGGRRCAGLRLIDQSIQRSGA